MAVETRNGAANNQMTNNHATNKNARQITRQKKSRKQGPDPETLNLI
jgi:hypothetical protein